MAVTDINFLSDLSASYSNDLPNYKEQIDATVNRLNNPNLSPVFGSNIQFLLLDRLLLGIMFIKTTLV